MAAASPPHGKELILAHFRPRVALICSPAAEAVAQKNGLTFAQFIEPFCTGTAECKIFFLILPIMNKDRL